MTDATISPTPFRAAPKDAAGHGVLMLLAAAAVLTSLVMRAYVGLDSPLWLDETWTGAFASERSLANLASQMRNDVNAPLYYVMMFFWAKAFGVSDLALRAPSLILSLLTPLAAWLGFRRRSPVVALAWASLLAVWIPAVELSGFARCYSLLLLSATLNLAAFVRLLERPTVRRACVWVFSGSVLVLVHYTAGFLALAQAGVLVLMARRKTLALWPAAFVAVPALVWIGVHAPRIADFARPDVAWYDRLSLADIPNAVSFFVDAPVGFLVVLIAIVVGLLVARAPRDADGPSAAIPPAYWAAGLASSLAVCACLTVAVLRPSFTVRYLMVFAPGVLFLVTCGVERIGVGRVGPQAALAGGFLALAALWMIKGGAGPRIFSFEPACAYLQQAKPDRLIFFWDHPATAVESESQLRLVGGFFFRRDGAPVVVVPLRVRTGEDASALAVKAAGPRDAILWLYDTTVHGTTAKTTPPRIEADDPRFSCRNFGLASIGVIACRRRAMT